MGADLTILKTDASERRGGFELSNRAVESGYFRDCYNGYGLFAVLSKNLGRSFSWWEMTDKYKDKWFVRDEENGTTLTTKGEKALLRKIKKARIELEAKPKIFYGYDEKNKKAGKKEYLDWCDLLIKFLELAIKLDSPIGWSV